MSAAIGAPSTPPASLTSSTATLAAALIVAPNWLVAPVSGMIRPTRTSSRSAARSRIGAAETARRPPNPAPALRTSRRLRLNMRFSMRLVFACSVSRRPQVAEKEMSNFIVLDQASSGLVTHLPSSNQDDAARSEFQRKHSFLLAHEDG